MTLMSVRVRDVTAFMEHYATDAYPPFTRTAKIASDFTKSDREIGKFLSFCPIFCNRI